MEKIPYEPESVAEHETIFENEWLKTKKTGHFIYSERKGVDSVAFVFIARNASDPNRIGLVHEYKDPLGRFVTTAFGGSIDDPKYHDDLRTLVIDEAVEEAGFSIGMDDIRYLGKVFCSTQMNQFVHLFVIGVDKYKQGEKTTTNPTELKASVKWMNMTELAQVQDWKSITIMTKFMSSKKAHLFAEPIKENVYANTTSSNPDTDLDVNEETKKIT